MTVFKISVMSLKLDIGRRCVNFSKDMTVKDSIWQEFVKNC